jgi:molybdopterin molybdotransferase
VTGLPPEARAELMRVEDAQRRIIELLAVPGGARTPEVVRVEAALGRVLAAPVVAATALPPWDNSAMDGYALRASDVAAASEGAPVQLAVTGEVAAGAAPTTEVQPGTTIRIATGAPIPLGADAVVQVELTTPVGPDGLPGSRGRDAVGPLPPAVLVHASVPRGANIRRAGRDIAEGERLLEPGTAMGPAQVALTAGAGVGEVAVHRRPRVGVLATGDEIRPPGEPLGPAGIPNANGPGLRALVTAAGADAVDLGIARDELADVVTRLEGAIAMGCDAVVVSGGVSVGPYDVVKAAFERLGHVDLWRVAVQPGKPFALATVTRGGTSADGGTTAAAAAAEPPVLLFGLPGNPVSGFVTFELFVRPAIRTLAGRRDPFRPVDRGVLLDEARTSPGRRAYLRVTAERDADGGVRRDARGRARVHLAGGAAGQGSHVLSALATAEALAVVPEAVETAPAGSPVDLLWLDTP